MTEKKVKQSIEPKFINFIFAKPQRNQFLIISAVYLLISIIISKLYPYPFTTADTGNYVYCAQLNSYGGYRPMGYSTFIRFFHDFNSSVQFVYIWQSIFNYIAVITFLFTVQYFFKLKNILFYVIAIIIVLHPDILRNTNTLLSDSLFNSLTLLWITTGIWMIMRQNIVAAILHCIILYFAISVRYIGLFYPILSAFIFILDYKKWKFISAMALVPLIILISTVQSVKNKTAELFGYETFSGFSGWAAANNAVAIIPYIELDPLQIPDKQVAAMHSLVISFNDTCYSWYHIKDTDFMWDKLFPGKALLGYNAQQLRIPYNAAWIYTGTQWKEYGTYLRNKYPLQFFRYYMVPNMGGVFEVFPYGSEKQYVPDNTSKVYFNVPVEKYEFKSSLFDNVYGYRLILYYAMLFSFIGLVIYAIIKRKTMLRENNTGRFLLFTAGFVFLYVAMSIYSHPIQNYRYLIPVYPVVIAVIAILGNVIWSNRITKIGN